MNYFRVSKYDFRNKYTYNEPEAVHEWTSIADVGEVFDGQLFTMQEYERVEGAYIDFVTAILQKCNIEAVTLPYFEKHRDRKIASFWKKKKELDIAMVRRFVRDCLRETCWGQLVADEFLWEAGYDYYMHIGTKLDMAQVRQIADAYQLFVEEWETIELIRH